MRRSLFSILQNTPALLLGILVLMMEFNNFLQDCFTLHVLHIDLDLNLVSEDISIYFLSTSSLTQYSHKLAYFNDIVSVPKMC